MLYKSYRTAVIFWSVILFLLFYRFARTLRLYWERWINARKSLKNCENCLMNSFTEKCDLLTDTVFLAIFCVLYHPSTSQLTSHFLLPPIVDKGHTLAGCHSSQVWIKSRPENRYSACVLSVPSHGVGACAWVRGRSEHLEPGRVWHLQSLNHSLLPRGGTPLSIEE